MGRYTLKEAAEITGRSVTTLRRYIRSGRLEADKTAGRFGPEFTLDEPALLAAGFEIEPDRGSRERTRPPDPRPESGVSSLPQRVENDRSNGSRSIEKALLDYVPADLYRELSMKHEQLLVQYGMIRASGQRLFEFREEAERQSEEVRRAGEQLRELQDRYAREIGFLKRHMRQAELEIEEKNQQITTLRQKLQVHELLTRNAITSESIERKFRRIFESERRVEAMISSTDEESPQGPDTLTGPDSPASPPDAEAPARREALDRWLEPGRPVRPGTDELDH